MQAVGVVDEQLLIDEQPSARVVCPAGLVPLPGQYVMAHAENSDDPLATILFAAGTDDAGFVCAPPIHPRWSPGDRLRMRGPLGRAFMMPPVVRRVALVPLGGGLAVLRPLLEEAVRRDAAVVVVSDVSWSELPLQVEVQPLSAVRDVLRWSDYAAFDVEGARPLAPFKDWQADASVTTAQVLVRMPMPCGGIADCGVCTVSTTSGPKLACKDGPVFEFASLILEG
jgi:NAD(P)H-flavin reductase